MRFTGTICGLSNGSSSPRLTHGTKDVNPFPSEAF